MNHTFVICVYKESSYLEECIQSVLGQVEPSKVAIATSTPMSYSKDLANQYGIQYHVNKKKGGIASDWNFAYSIVDTPYVTIAHQDDIYEPNYSKEVVAQFEKEKHPLIAFTDYGEIHKNVKKCKQTNLKIKRMLLRPFLLPGGNRNRFIRRRILSIGNPICCPSVSYAKENLPKKLFRTHFRSNVDWETWEKLSQRKGSFCYIPKCLMFHRIHGESETSAMIQDNMRKKEDYEMFCKFWPKWMAKLLVNLYSKSEKGNEI